MFLSERTHTHLCQISEDNHTKEDGFKEDILLLKDILDDKVHKEYQYMRQEGDNTLC